MTFTDWYKETKNDVWHEDYRGLYSFCYEMCCEYGEYCKENNLIPIWNG